MEFNLYELADNRINKGNICCIINDNLLHQIKIDLFKIKKKINYNKLAEKLGITYPTLWRYINKRSIPIIILKRLEKISNSNYSLYITNLTCRKSNQITIPKELDENLAKIIGTILADGHLKIRKSERGYHYELVIREEFKCHIKAFCKWIEHVFNFQIKPKKQLNHYYIYISNKIIVKFFTEIIKLPQGKKSDIIFISDIIKNADDKIKIGFLKGLFMFDGGVDYRTGYVNLISKSQKLIQDTNNLLIEIGLNPDYISTKEDKLGRCKLRVRKKEKLRDCIILFEEDTEKWYRLKEHLEGLEGEAKDLNTALRIFDKVYPQKRHNSITFSDVLIAVDKLNRKASMDNISKKLQRKKTVTYEFLKKLEKWKVLGSKRNKYKKHWYIQYPIPIPRRD